MLPVQRCDADHQENRRRQVLASVLRAPAPRGADRGRFRQHVPHTRRYLTCTWVTFSLSRTLTLSLSLLHSFFSYLALFSVRSPLDSKHWSFASTRRRKLCSCSPRLPKRRPSGSKNYSSSWLPTRPLRILTLCQLTIRQHVHFLSTRFSALYKLERMHGCLFGYSLSHSTTFRPPPEA